MFRALVPLLACPDTRERLRIAVPAGDDASDPLKEAVLATPSGRRYRVTESVPRLLPEGAPKPEAAATRRAFERQWRHYGRLPRLFGKDPARMRENLVGARMGGRIDAAWYRGRTVLDAGCGHGRYLAAFASLGATAVGVDVGTGPETAGVPTDDPRIHVVQGDVTALPFADGVFDLAFCDGVLHHTPDPRRGFAELARVVRPGGAVYVWLYPREGLARETVFSAARAVTTRMPGPVVRGLCFAIAPLTAGVRSYSGTKFPRATWGECAQVVHDWLAPPLQSHHTEDELFRWAREEGLVDATPHPIPVGLTAWKTRAVPEPPSSVPFRGDP